MVRPKVAIALVAVLVVGHLAHMAMRAGFDTADLLRDLGTRVVAIGLPGVGGKMLTTSADMHRSRVRQLRKLNASSKQIPEEVAGLVESEKALAALFFARKQYGVAEKHLRNAGDADPQLRDDITCLIADIDLARKEYDQAQSAALRVWAQGQDNPRAAYVAGKVFAARSKPGEARTYFTKAIEAAAKQPQAGASAAVEYAARLELIRLAGKASKGQPADAKLVREQGDRALALATSLTRTRQVLQAMAAAGVPHPGARSLQVHALLASYGKALVVLVALPLVLFLPGIVSLLSRRFPGIVSRVYLAVRSIQPVAIECYERALVARPSDRRLLWALARAYTRLHATSGRAAELYEQLWRTDLNDHEALAQLVRICIATSRTDAVAVEACEQWFQLNKRDLELHELVQSLTRIYRQRGMDVPETALEVVQRALDYSPQDLNLRRYLGALYDHFDYKDKAVDVLEPVVEHDPEDQAARKMLARALIGAERCYEAYRHLRVLHRDGETNSDLYLAGLGCAQKGQHKQALRILQEAMRRDPTLFDIQQRIMEVATQVDERRVGSYELETVLSEQEAFVLHRATHLEHGAVLVAVYRNEFSDQLAFPSGFAAYATALRAVESDVALAPVDAGSADETFYMAYRVPEGALLPQVTEEVGLFSFPRAATLLIEVLRGLTHLHRAGILHGDLRPEDVWVTGDGHVYVLCAGLALLARQVIPEHSSAAVGSPHHIAPEIVQRQPPSMLTDMYAAGCLLYRVLVGRPPVDGPSRLAAMMAHVTVEPPAPSGVVPSLYAEVDRVVLSAMAKDPTYRYQTAEALSDDLRRTAALPEGPLRLDLGAAVETTTPSRGLWWYEFDEVDLLTVGRFARLYRGVDKTTRQIRCIKEVNPPAELTAGTADQTMARAANCIRRLFLNEIHLLSSLAEPTPPTAGVLRIDRVFPGEHGAEPAYSSELLLKTLAQHIQEEGPQPEHLALALFVSVLEPVARLHELGITHRNLSPSSTMLGGDGVWRLVGFDRACHAEDRPALLAAEREIQAASQAPAETIGDCSYLSPEQCRAETFDERSDVYALGCILFYILTGRAPFAAEAPLETMLLQISAEPPKASSFGFRVSASTEELIQRAMAKSPDERYQNAAAFKHAIERLVQLSGMGAAEQHAEGAARRYAR